jgi:hypothetical protein
MHFTQQHNAPSYASHQPSHNLSYKSNNNYSSTTKAKKMTAEEFRHLDNKKRLETLMKESSFQNKSAMAMSDYQTQSIGHYKRIKSPTY